MIHQTMEHISSHDNKDYYLNCEVGFTHKAFAKKNHLYEFFGRSFSSTFYEIFTKNLYENNFLTQVWVFENDKPVGLALGVQFDPIKTLSHDNKQLGEILGQIQLYVVPEFRKKGIAKEMVKILNDNFLNNQQGLVIMQDDAMFLKKEVKNLIPIPYDYKEKINEIDKDIKVRSILAFRNNQTAKSSLTC